MGYSLQSVNNVWLFFLFKTAEGRTMGALRVQNKDGTQTWYYDFSHLGLADTTKTQALREKSKILESVINEDFSYSTGINNLKLNEYSE